MAKLLDRLRHRSHPLHIEAADRIEALEVERAALNKIAEAASDFELGCRDNEFASLSGGIEELAAGLRLALDNHAHEFLQEDCRNSPV